MGPYGNLKVILPVFGIIQTEVLHIETSLVQVSVQILAKVPKVTLLANQPANCSFFKPYCYCRSMHTQMQSIARWVELGVQMIFFGMIN